MKKLTNPSAQTVRGMEGLRGVRLEEDGVIVLA